MTSKSLFDVVAACADKVQQKFNATGALGKVTRSEILIDKEYTALRYRRAHISIIDARQTKKLYLLHVTVFPHTNDSSPIFGFDIVCGPTKVSGAFHDFSAAGDRDHYMGQWFESKTTKLEWNKPRELPDWAKQIFSPGMVAIGAVGPEELEEFISLGLENLDYYLKYVGFSQESLMDYHMAQNRYCHYQKQNPRVYASLQHLGYTEQEAIDYVRLTLFPELV
jgi:hypothetical protein